MSAALCVCVSLREGGTVVVVLLSVVGDRGRTEGS